MVGARGNSKRQIPNSFASMLDALFTIYDDDIGQYFL